MDTVNENKYPNFFIVGAAKSGTSSLYEYLKQHPEIYMSLEKEPLFFLPHDQVVNHKYKKWDNYISLFQNVNNEKAIGEASTPYLYYHESAKKIKNTFPNSKIIILLRNPVEMSFSLYLHALRMGAEELPFDKAIEVEEERINDPNFIYKSKTHHAGRYYLSRAKYYRQVKNYLDIFDKDKVMIILFEDLKTKPVETCKQVFSFLGVDPTFVPEIKIHNPSLVPKSFYLNRIFRYSKIFNTLLKLIIPRDSKRLEVKEKIIHMNLTSQKKISIDPELEKQLLHLFLDDINKLEKLLNVDLSNWKRESLVKNN